MDRLQRAYVSFVNAHHSAGVLAADTVDMYHGELIAAAQAVRDTHPIRECEKPKAKCHCHGRHRG